MYTVKLILQAIVLPPMGLVLMAVAGFFLRRRNMRMGNGLIAAAAVLFLVLSLPAVSGILRATLERHQALSPTELEGAGAIVILSGGLYPASPEYGGRDTIAATSLFRARYGAWLHKQSGLPILVVGSRIVPSKLTEAEVMADVLRDEFRVPVRWVVGEGRDTLESAAAARRVLGRAKIDRIALVATRGHMVRAELAFGNLGFRVLAAPTGFRTPGALTLRHFLPSAGGMSASAYYIKEWLGAAWSLVAR